MANMAKPNSAELTTLAHKISIQRYPELMAPSQDVYIAITCKQNEMLQILDALESSVTPSYPIIADTVRTLKTFINNDQEGKPL